MNSQKNIFTTIFKIPLAVFIFCLLPVSILGQDHRLPPTGLLPPTEEEKKLMEKEWKKIDTVSPNEIAIDRISKEREVQNLPKLRKEDVKFIWKDNVDRLKHESDLNTQLLPDYLPSVDNSKLPAFPPIRSQESLPSCAPFSVTYYQLTHMVSLKEGWNNKNEDNSTKFSPKWTYNFLNQGELKGVGWYTIYNFLEKHGAVTWEEFPYVGSTSDPKNYREWCLNTEAWENALHYRINHVEYLYLDTTAGFEQFKQLMVNGFVAIFGTYIYSWQWAEGGIKDDPSTTDDDKFVGERACYWLKGASGAHSMTVVGYNDTLWIDVNENDIVDSGEKGAFLVANSWGPGWENNGFAWVAYDALYTESKVDGGPSDDRWMVFMNTKVVLLRVKDSYEPSAVAKFTVNSSKRSQMGVMLGISDVTEKTPTSIWSPGAIIFQGGEYAFDGTTTPTDGTFIFDFTDLYKLPMDWKVFYLSVQDNVFGDSATVKDFRLIDYEKGGTSYISSEVPQDVDGESLLFPVTELGDIPPGYWAAQHIYKIYEAGITTGCSKKPLKYCPEYDVTRTQMAIFLGRGIHGSSFTPPPATGVFDDVPVNYWAADWIEQFYDDGVTTGCEKTPLKYCPSADVTRAQMAIFLLRSKYGKSYNPPKATGIFSDVPINSFAADWIEQLYKEGITTGCKKTPLMYCPESSVTRAQMAKFIVRTFGL